MGYRDTDPGDVEAARQLGRELNSRLKAMSEAEADAFFEELMVGRCRMCFQETDGRCWACYDSPNYD